MAVTPPTGSNIPLTGVYKEQQAQAQQAYNDALASINQKQGETMRTYGYTGDFDPLTGAVTNQQFDASNPYGLIQQSMNQFNTGDRQLKEDAYARGLSGESGLGSQDRGLLQDAFAGQQVEMGRGYLSQLQGVNQDRMSAKSQLAESMLQAQMNSINASIQNQLYTPVANAATDSAGGELPSGSMDPYGDSGGIAPDVPAAPVAPVAPTANPNNQNATTIAAQNGLNWGGQTFVKKAAFVAWLNQHGTTYKKWKENNPGAAAAVEALPTW